MKTLREKVVQRISDIMDGDLSEVDFKGNEFRLNEIDTLTRLLSILKDDDYIDVPEPYFVNAKMADGHLILNSINEDASPCSKCSNYLESVRTGKPLICHCTLGTPSITCSYEYKSNVQ